MQIEPSIERSVRVVFFFAQNPTAGINKWTQIIVKVVFWFRVSAQSNRKPIYRLRNIFRANYAWGYILAAWYTPKAGKRREESPNGLAKSNDSISSIETVILRLTKKQ